MIQVLSLRFFPSFLLLWLCVAGGTLRAQINLKVGYTASIFDWDASNDLLERFSEARPYLDDTWDPIRFLNGVDVGITYQTEVFGLEAGYEFKFGQRDARGIPPGATADFRERLFYNVQGYYLGAKAGYDFLFAGVNVVQNRLRMSFENDDLDDRLTLLRDNFQTLQCYLSLEPNRRAPFRIALRPYVEIPLRNNDLRAAAEFLEPDFAAGQPDDFYEERWVQYGLRIVFFNGR